VNEQFQPFYEKSSDELSAELIGFPLGTLEAVLKFRDEASIQNLKLILPGFIAFHLPVGVSPPSEPLSDELLLVQDFGLDSLALSEMAFKMEELFGFYMETQDVFGIESYGDLVAFLSNKLELS